MKNFVGVACSSAGASHIRSGRECQDTSMYISGKEYAAIMVADGHGGDKHFRSAVGSKIAGEICERILPGYVREVCKCKDLKILQKMLQDFEKHLIYCWREEISNELIMNPIMDQELECFSKEIAIEIENHPHIAFGTTLILAVVAGGYVQIIQLGDGDCRIKTGNGIERPLPEDGSLCFGRTASLCNENAFERIRDVILPDDSFEACFLSTDGVRNSFDTEEHFSRFIDTLIDELSVSKDETQTELESFLPRLSSEGSGDDVSIALMMKNYGVVG